MPFMCYVTLYILLLEGAIQMNLPCLYLLNRGVKVKCHMLLIDNIETYCNFTLVTYINTIV